MADRVTTHLRLDNFDKQIGASHRCGVFALSGECVKWMASTPTQNLHAM